MQVSKILLLMDPLETININKDTSFALALEAQNLGFPVWFASIESLFLKNEKPFILTRQVHFKRETPCWEFLTKEETIECDAFSHILMRTDPPVNEAFLFATHFLSLCKKAIVVNRPQSLREAPEKLYSLQFPQVIPPTLITKQAEQIKEFMLSVGGEIILKPLNGHGGKGIVYLHTEDKNFYSLFELVSREGADYVQAQQYLPEIKDGDKRIICVNGKPLGGIARVPSNKDHRGNLHVGGLENLYELSQHDLWLVSQITERLQKDGLFFVGIDIIGKYITEINVTSPTGIQEIEALSGTNIARHFWETLPSFAG